MSDIVVSCQLGQEPMQKTDIHYRSKNGEGTSGVRGY